MNPHTWFTFFAACWLIAISPGSGAVLSMSHGLSYGVKKTSATIAGLQIGLLLILFVAGAGVGSILLASETMFTVVKTVGALYLIYLGLSQWRAKVDTCALQRPEPTVRATPPSVRKRMLLGFMTNATNPKGIIFMVAVLPQFISADGPLLPQLMILAMTMCTVDLMVMHGYAFAASTMQGYFRDARAVKKQNRFFGGVLMAVGTALFFVKRGA
ncbi:lysE type translocator family protein [Collimonas arenae]|uniref:LysE type translocator family protein n=1 Tax=Collimonas arenae TaxID=279058 RepID=A0A127QHK2_9BURK|nr:LysE family transporter [Collimonas arenae]AMO99639.1 lysE type translocator family protein [Collimonas arenae]AMP09537.1 lysE type translocator family protein [Collimonas arenae]